LRSPVRCRHFPGRAREYLAKVETRPHWQTDFRQNHIWVRSLTALIPSSASQVANNPDSFQHEKSAQHRSKLCIIFYDVDGDITENGRDEYRIDGLDLSCHWTNLLSL
jgi:hypothetical protein